MMTMMAFVSFSDCISGKVSCKMDTFSCQLKGKCNGKQLLKSVIIRDLLKLKPAAA